MSEPAHNYLAWRIGELEQHVALVARVKELETGQEQIVGAICSGSEAAAQGDAPWQVILDTLDRQRKQLQALVDRVAELERDAHSEWLTSTELRQQHNAAVAVLRAAKGPQLVPDAWSRTAQLDVGISEALAALGAEETK